MSITEHCPKCGAAIPPYAPSGLCLKCMFQNAFDAAEEDIVAPASHNESRCQLSKVLREPNLSVGTRVGVFEIVARLGAGGQGDVYRAHDSKLGRDVAIKVLPEEYLDQVERLTRFEREAKILAALNHPNIGALYDLREEDHLHFLVLELVDGETLSKRIAEGAIPVADAIPIAIQIAEALDAAHERGIIHRDLKPANVMLTERGAVKVLDFGIAKALEDPAGQSPPSGTGLAASIPSAQTGEFIIGTPAYMAPEQRAGLGVDQRTDIWALGSVLYEMISGRPSWRTCPTDVEQLHTADGSAPCSSLLLREVSPGLTHMLSRMLNTNPDLRFQHMKEVLEVLRELRTGLGPRSVKGGNAAAPSIAILPFINIDGDPANEYFSDGLAEELIWGLNKLPGLRVAARSSSFRFRGMDLDIRDVGRQLGVSSVLEGSVRRAGSRLRVTAKLVSTADGYHLWSERYDRDADDVFAIQDEIAVAIVENLRSEMLDEEKARLSMQHTGSLEAHDLYLKARHHLNSISLDRLWKSVECFRGAIQLDPGYALAYAGLTESYCSLGLWGLIDPREAAPKARAAAMKALALDETLSEVHHALGLLSAFSGEWSNASREFRRAIELRPDHASGRACHAMYLRFTAGRERALAEMNVALELEPHSVLVNAGAAYLHFSFRRYDDAIRQSHKILAMEPNFFQAHGYLAFAYARKGMLDESIAEWRALLCQRGYGRLAWGVQRAYKRAGYGGALKKIAQRSVLAYYAVRLLRWIPRKERRFCTPMLPAVMYAEAGEKDLAFKWLNKACEERTPLMIGITEDPPWDGLRSDPRFHEVIAKIEGGPVCEDDVS